MVQYFYLYLFIIAIVGLVIGSFLNVVIYRLPLLLEQQWRKQCQEFLKLPTQAVKENFNLAWPRSHCPHCKTSLKFYHNIPLLSFIFLKGQCGFCATKISWQYPLVELASGLLAVFTLWQLGFNSAGLAGVILTWCLIALTVIDLKTQLLPDNITLPLIWIGLLLNIFGVFTSLESAVIGAFVGYLSLWSVNYIFRLIKGIDGMGYGDFKLFAVFGAWFGWPLLLFIILVAAGVGAIVGVMLILFKGHDREIPIPFGPYLAIAGWIGMLWGQYVLKWYLE